LRRTTALVVPLLEVRVEVETTSRTAPPVTQGAGNLITLRTLALLIRWDGPIQDFRRR
jgi:hypothetical protein